MTNPQRIGGEMVAWSDRDPRRGPDVPRGAVLRHLLGTLACPGRTVLVAGPHDDDLVAALTGAGAEVSWLLRAPVDAEEAARMHPGVTVLAGAPVKLDPAARFDLVVAVDGVDRLDSAEGDQLGVTGLVRRLAEAVAPDGTLLLAYENRLGLHEIVRLPEPRRDAEWYPADEHDPARPASRAQLEALIIDAGLVPGPTYAMFPEPSAPTVLVGPAVLGDVASPLRAPLAAVLGRAFATAFRGRPVLADPRRLLTRALRAGAEDMVAAGWLVVARGTEAGPARAYDVLAADPDGAFAYEPADGGAFADEPADGGVFADEPAEGGAFADEPAGDGALSPAGRTGADYLLEERLLHLCAAADLPGMRVELGRFAAWLDGQAPDGVLTGSVAVAGFGDVLVTEAGPVVLPAAWEAVEPVLPETALVRACREFAVELITAGHAHPWPVTADAAELTGMLLGVAGREALVPAAAPVDADGYRELTQALERERARVDHLRELMAWTEQIIRSRDHALSRMDWELRFYQRSWPGRLVTFARRAYGAVKKLRSGPR